MDDVHRIVLFINTLGSGGAQRQIVLLARELSRSFKSVTLLHYGSSEHMLGMLLDNDAVQVVRVAPSERSGKLSLLLSLVRALIRSKPTHLVSFIDTPNYVFGFLSYIFFRKVVWVPSERNLVISSSARESILRRVLFRRARCIVSNSRSQNEWMVRNVKGLADKCCVIMNGVPDEMLAPDFHPSDRKEKVRFVVLGRLGYQKNPSFLVDAVSILPLAIRARVSFNWYGEDDPDSPGLRTLLEERVNVEGLPIVFHRATSNVISVLDEADAFVLCSRFEGTPNVVLEAMARGKVVIASSVSDVPYLLADGRGILFSPDDISDFIGAISKCLSQSADDSYSMGLGAYRFVRSECAASSMAINYVRALGLN